MRGNGYGRRQSDQQRYSGQKRPTQKSIHGHAGNQTPFARVRWAVSIAGADRRPVGSGNGRRDLSPAAPVKRRDYITVSSPPMYPCTDMAPLQPAGPVPQGSWQCHSNVPAAPVWNVNVVRLDAKRGTLMWREGIVKVCDTIAGSTAARVCAGPVAGPLGLAVFTATVVNLPSIPAAVAYFVYAPVKGVAPSKFSIVIITSLLAGTVTADGRTAGPTSVLSMSGVATVR